jgi:hypothetical protein
MMLCDVQDVSGNLSSLLSYRLYLFKAFAYFHTVIIKILISVLTLCNITVSYAWKPKNI